MLFSQIYWQCWLEKATLRRREDDYDFWNCIVAQFKRDHSINTSSTSCYNYCVETSAENSLVYVEIAFWNLCSAICPASEFWASKVSYTTWSLKLFFGLCECELVRPWKCSREKAVNLLLLLLLLLNLLDEYYLKQASKQEWWIHKGTSWFWLDINLFSHAELEYDNMMPVVTKVGFFFPE